MACSRLCENEGIGEAPAWNNLGNVLTKHLGQHQEAEKAYRRAIEIDENDAYPWDGLRELYWRHGRCREAESCARQGLAIETGTDPIRPEILWNLAMLRLCLGHPDDARDLLQKARDAIHEPADLDLMQLAVAAALDDSALLARAQARRAEVLARQDGRTIAHALLIEGLVVPERLAEAKEVAWRHANDRPRLLRHLEDIHFICGLRPEVRARGQALAAELLDLLDRFPERFTDVVALPDAWFDRYRPFAAGKSNGAGDPRDRARFCPDA